MGNGILSQPVLSRSAGIGFADIHWTIELNETYTDIHRHTGTNLQLLISKFPSSVFNKLG